ncbi:membrane fusion protein, multidrug efflux system [Filimonas lacunae]|uniref:Membrane fusion protein, multidrug efflux system n=1 Tax=Filimonas lacunae TaxID=477680 RepID=A0A173ME55_9BACT|nr:efflux RND transporter periplasmic adaptor subunit [Filimonas lacunae]BAV05718.1 Co/Zn/Cd efflux system membrane fusion protein [Filimonas lacunae]SIT28805.1 membrane fusion protein, multidrug efflux system [Filimonas lacunae]
MKKYNDGAGSLLLVVAVLVFSSCGNAGNNQSKQAQMATGPKSYSVKTIAPEKVTLYTDYPATIQGEQEVEIRPKIDGYVEKIFVDEGATVTKGQVLFQIFSPQYQQELRTAEAGIKTAEADVNTAQMEVNKVRPLVEKDIISKFQLESAEYTLQSKKAALAQAQATLANARANVGYTTITSPVNGVIGTLPNKVGSLVSSTSTNPLTTVTSSGNMYAYFGLNEKQLLELSRRYKGNTLQQKLKQMPVVSLLLSDGSEYTEKGRVETASGFITTETGSSNLRATFPNPVGILKSGNSGNVRVPRAVDSALVIPQSATYDLQGKRFVYVLAKDSTVKNTAITVSATPDGQSFVVESGLQNGDVVVTQGTNELKDGVKIVPQPQH